MNSSSFTKQSSPFSNKLIKIIATVFLSVYLLIWAISSPLSKHFIEPILLEQGLTLSDDASIYYNPFLSQITISDLALFTSQDNAQEKVFSIDKLTVRLTLFRLLFDKIVISKFELNDAYLKVIKTPSQFIVAGIDINKLNANKPQEKETEAVSEPLPYQLILPKLALNRFNIDVSNNEIPHQVSIKELLISQVKADQKYQTALVSLISAIDETALEITADAEFNNGQGEINNQLSITNYPLQRLKRYISELSDLSGLLSLSVEQKITIEPKQINLNVAKAQLNTDQVAIGYEQQFFYLEKLENNINNLKLTFKNDEITELSGTSHLVLNNADIHHEKSSQKVAYFNQLTLEDISFHFFNEPQIKIANLIIDDILGSKNEETEHPPLVTLKQFNIQDILISEKQLSIDKIILDNLKAEAIIDKESALANLVTLPITAAEKEELSKVASTIDQEINPQQADFTISLNEFSLINDSQLSLIDNSVEPIKERTVFIDTLHLGAISNAIDKQEQETPFELIGRSNKYAHFNFKGFTQPFAKEQKHHFEGFLKELSLPAVSRYMKKAMQMELKSGQLNTDVNVTLTGDQLEGNLVLLLQGLETAIADSDEAGALIDQGALPFNIALGMIKDGKGNVELDVPLSGSTSDPSFGMSSIVTLITQKAIWMATQDYLMTTFVPYANIVSVAMTVGEFALKLRFDDLIYQTKQIEPNKAQQDYLKAFIDLMQDKEDTRVNICAISTPADINLESGNKITNKKHISQLKEIGEQREAAFKDYMIKHGDIASSRLLLCAPKIDSSKEAKPRIELSV